MCTKKSHTRSDILYNSRYLCMYMGSRSTVDPFEYMNELGLNGS